MGRSRSDVGRPFCTSAKSAYVAFANRFRIEARRSRKCATVAALFAWRRKIAGLSIFQFVVDFICMFGFDARPIRGKVTRLSKSSLTLLGFFKFRFGIWYSGNCRVIYWSIRISLNFIHSFKIWLKIDKIKSLLFFYYWLWAKNLWIFESI